MTLLVLAICCKVGDSESGEHESRPHSSPTRSITYHFLVGLVCPVVDLLPD